MATSARIRRESAQATLKRLRTYVCRLERRYESPSEAMVEAVRSGSVHETAEISRWLSSYQVLRGLEERFTRTTGTVETLRDA